MAQPVSGHVFRFEGKRRPVWRAKYRLPVGRQVKKTLGPAWTARGRPPAGYFTKGTFEAWLRRTLVEAAAGTLPGMVRTGATVAWAAFRVLCGSTPASVRLAALVEADVQRARETTPESDAVAALRSIRAHADVLEAYVRDSRASD
jgi:hypothetical protein